MSGCRVVVIVVRAAACSGGSPGAGWANLDPDPNGSSGPALALTRGGFALALQPAAD